MKQMGGIIAVVCLMVISIGICVYTWILRKLYRLIYREDMDSDWF